MTRRQLVFGLSSLGVAVVLIACVAVVSVIRYQRQAEINAQTQIERTRLEQAGKLERTRKRMNAIPWYKGGENKDKP